MVTQTKIYIVFISPAAACLLTVTVNKSPLLNDLIDEIKLWTKTDTRTHTASEEENQQS